MSPHGEFTWYSNDSDFGGGRRERRLRYLQCVVPTFFEFSGMPGIGMYGKGKNSGDIEEGFHVTTLEVEGGYHAGGTRTTTNL